MIKALASERECIIIKSIDTYLQELKADENIISIVGMRLSMIE